MFGYTANDARQERHGNGRVNYRSCQAYRAWRSLYHRVLVCYKLSILGL